MQDILRICAFQFSCAAVPDTLFGAQILGPIFGWEDLFKSRPKLGANFAAMQADPAGARVRSLLQFA